MKKLMLVMALMVVPVFASAQQVPDSARPGRPDMRAGMEATMRDMTPEQREAYAQGFRHGRMAAARAALGRGMGRGDGPRMAARGAGLGLCGPGMALRTELGLTDDQVKKLDEIRTRQRALHQPRMAALRTDREKWLQQRELFQQQTRALMLEVLTPEQRTKLEELEKQAPDRARRGRW